MNTPPTGPTFIGEIAEMTITLGDALDPETGGTMPCVWIAGRKIASVAGQQVSRPMKEWEVEALALRAVSMRTIARGNAEEKPSPIVVASGNGFPRG